MHGTIVHFCTVLQMGMTVQAIAIHFNNHWDRCTVLCHSLPCPNTCYYWLLVLLTYTWVYSNISTQNHRNKATTLDQVSLWASDSSQAKPEPINLLHFPAFGLLHLASKERAQDLSIWACSIAYASKPSWSRGPVLVQAFAQASHQQAQFSKNLRAHFISTSARVTSSLQCSICAHPLAHSTLRADARGLVVVAETIPYSLPSCISLSSSPAPELVQIHNSTQWLSPNG